MQVRAVAEGTVPEVLAEFREARRQLGRRDLEEAQLADAGGVREISAGGTVDRMQLGMRRRVATSTVEDLADVAGVQPQPGLHRVEQGRLSDPRRPGDDREPSREPSPQLLEPDARPRARVEHVIADALVHAESLTRRIGADEVGLVRDEDRRNLVVLGNDQEAVDQPRIRWRPVAGEHDGDEVRVGDDDVLAPRAARTGLPAAESMRARLDGDDRAGAIGKPLELDAIADDREV